MILATVRWLDSILRLRGFGEAAGWIRLLIGLDVIFFPAGFLIFEWVIES